MSAGCTVRVDSLPYRKWKEIKLQPGTSVPGNMLGCCLIYFHFRWGKLSTLTVYCHSYFNILKLQEEQRQQRDDLRPQRDGRHGQLHPAAVLQADQRPRHTDSQLHHHQGGDMQTCSGSDL